MIEVRIPAAVAGAISAYTPAEGEVPSIAMVDADGRSKRGRPGRLFDL